MFRAPAACLLLLAACQPVGDAPGRGDDDSTLPGDDSDDSGAPSHPDRIRFGVTFGDTPVNCTDEITGVGKSAAAVRLQDARFFVHDLVFSGPSGEAAFIPDESEWTDGTLVLVDLEDGANQCGVLGTPETHDEVEGYIPDGDWDTLTFTVGVPFEVNHLPPTHSDPPLDTPSLFLTPQTGHVFLRADVRNSVIGTVQSFSALIASSGCASAASDIAPAEPCARPGLARIRLPYDPFRTDLAQIVSLDLEALYKGVNVQQDQGGAPGCQVRSDDTHECSPIFASLGMSYATGACVDDCANQTAFRTICRDAEGAVTDCP